MATASNVQREPSMEEILASIRRIIEDSDSGRKPTDPFTSDGAEASEEAAPAVVDVFRSELRSGAESVSLTPKAGAPEVSRSAADAGSAVEDSRIGDKEPEGSSLANSQSAFTKIDFTRNEFSRPSLEAIHKPAEAADDWHVPVDQPTFDSREGTGTDLPPPAGRLADAPVDSEPADGQKPAIESAVSGTVAAKPVLTPETSEAAAARPVLVSEKTSRQVAAAFEELSEAFAARSKRSLDEMAEEMLRPMLQEWLDNNLPTLVEKLVREEIERVARGT